MKKQRRMTAVSNSYGIRVRRCCASCGHKEIKTNGKRRCVLSGCRVAQADRCPRWEMSRALQRAGKGDGLVKRGEYLMMVRDVRIRELEAIDEGLMSAEQMVPVKTLRRAYTPQDNGKPTMVNGLYINM